MIRNVLLIIIIIIIIVFYFHSKKYYYQNKKLSIEQLETYDYKNAENIIKNKQIMIIRNYHKLNKFINLENLIKYNKSIQIINHSDYTINNIINGLYNSFLLYKFRINNKKLMKKLKIIRQFGSDISILKEMFISYGKRDDSTTIINLKYNRNFFHILKGEITIFLIKPRKNIKDKLYLKNTDNNSILNSEINVRNPNYKEYPKFKKINQNTIQIILREGNLLFIPNNWSYYIFYNKETVLLNYLFHTPISKVLSFF